MAKWYQHNIGLKIPIIIEAIISIAIFIYIIIIGHGFLVAFICYILSYILIDISFLIGSTNGCIITAKKNSKEYVLGISAIKYLFAVYFNNETKNNRKALTDYFYQSVINSLDEMVQLNLVSKGKDRTFCTETWIKLSTEDIKQLKAMGVKIKPVSNLGWTTTILLKMSDKHYGIIRENYSKKQYYKYSISIKNLIDNYKQLVEIIINAKTYHRILEELLNERELTGEVFMGFLDNKGLDNVSKDDLDAIIRKFGTKVFQMYNFNNFYNMKLADETNSIMVKWTRAIGILTLVMTVIAIISA